MLSHPSPFHQNLLAYTPWDRNKSLPHINVPYTTAIVRKRKQTTKTPHLISRVRDQFSIIRSEKEKLMSMKVPGLASATFEAEQLRL